MFKTTTTNIVRSDKCCSENHGTLLLVCQTNRKRVKRKNVILFFLKKPVKIFLNNSRDIIKNLSKKKQKLYQTALLDLLKNNPLVYNFCKITKKFVTKVVVVVCFYSHPKETIDNN